MVVPNICGSSECFLSSFWRLEFWGGFWIFGKFLHSCIHAYIHTYIHAHMLASTQHTWLHALGRCLTLLFDTVFGRFGISVLPWRAAVQTNVLHQLLQSVWTNARIYRVSQEERTKLRESVPYVKLYQYNPKHLYPKLNGYGDNDQRKVWTSCISAYCMSTAV